MPIKFLLSGGGVGVSWKGGGWKRQFYFNGRRDFSEYLNNVQQMVSGESAGECLQTGFERHGSPPQRDLLDTVYPLRDHLKSVQRFANGVLRLL